MLALGGAANAQTLVSPTIQTSTWLPSGNPYVISENATVPAGHTLTLEPGVVVWVGQGLGITVNGSIQANGTPTNRITFTSPTPSWYWREIRINHAAGVTNRFKYCDFQNATNAVSLYVSGATMVAELFNNSFSNCVAEAILGQATGDWDANTSGARVYHAYLQPVIKNCMFRNTGGGCRFTLQGRSSFVYGVTGRGYSDFKLIGNAFVNVTNRAVSLEIGSYAGGGSPEIVNNTFVQCAGGVFAQDPWDAVVQNNILVESGSAVVCSGSLSRAVSYNCFFANATNFTGYPWTYGQAILQNRNGTACDLLYNLFVEPQFVGDGDFRLTDSSPCIDAGDATNPNYGDLCFEVSKGTGISDLGAYGGADACNWLDVVPRLPTTPWMTVSESRPLIHWDAIPRSTYRIQYLTNVTDLEWKALMDVTAPQKRTATEVSATSAERYFRIQSLGRTPGH